MTLWLIRHGSPERDPARACGRTDVPLSKKGIRESEKLAELLSGEPLDSIHSSDLVRAYDTATPLAAVKGLPVVRHPELRELDFGDYEGRELALLWEEHPDDAARWEQDMRAFPPQFGETFDELMERVGVIADELPGDGCAIVAHRGTLSALLALLTGCTYEEAFARDWGYAVPMRVEPC